MLNFGVGLDKLRLAKLDYGTEPQVVAGLREFHGLRCLIDELLGERNPLGRSVGI
jgi:hypothetical protein